MKHLLQNHLRLLVLAFATFFLSACNPGIVDDPIPCTAQYVPTATISASDIDGKPLADYQVTYNQWPAPTGVTNITCTTTSACDLQFLRANTVVELTVTKEGYQPFKLSVVTPIFNCGNQQTERFTVVLKPLI